MSDAGQEGLRMITHIDIPDNIEEAIARVGIEQIFENWYAQKKGQDKQEVEEKPTIDKYLLVKGRHIEHAQYYKRFIVAGEFVTETYYFQTVFENSAIAELVITHRSNKIFNVTNTLKIEE